ncbi:MAG: hypothetical protein K9K64_05230 [Desulfohalobiaceae bacterium]|nr:hypothetical protein [Desulfohalobiaceae bacterium]
MPHFRAATGQNPRDPRRRKLRESFNPPPSEPDRRYDGEVWKVGLECFTWGVIAGIGILLLAMLLH